MAKSEEVFIYLQAVGAGETRREIDNVSRALDRLNKRTGSHTKTLDDNTKAQGANNVQTARANQLNDTRANTMGRVNKVHQDFNRLMRMTDNLDKRYAGTQRTILDNVNKRQRAIRNLDRTANLMARREIQRAQATEKSLKTIAERGWKEQEKIARKYQRRINGIRGGGGGGRGLFGGGGRGGPHIRPHSFRMAGIGVLIGTAIEGIPILGTGLNALGAAGLAAANGLAPLVGLLGALPAGILALGSVGTVLAMATRGLGAAIGGDAKAMAELGPNTREFVQAIIDAKAPMRGLQRSVQDTFMLGLGPEIRSLVNTYLPLLHTHLGTIASDINASGRGLTGWLTSSDGRSVMQNIFANNEAITARFMTSGVELLQLFLRLGQAAGPMLTAMAEDFMQWVGALNGSAARNPQGLEDFFTNSYERFKQVLAVLTDFGVGIYNLVSLADPLTDFLGDWITDVADGFRAWTESAEGQQDITQYFEDMREPMRAIIDLAGALARGLFEISRSDNFVKFLDKLSGEGGLIDGLVSIFKNADTTFLDAWVVFFSAIETFAAEGGLKTLGEIALTIANALQAIVNAWAGLPKELQDVVVAAAVAGFVVKGAGGGLLGGGGGLLGGLGAGAAGGALSKAAIAKTVGGLLLPVVAAGGAATIWEQNRTKGFGKAQADINADVGAGMWARLFGNSTAAGAGSYDKTGLSGSLQRFGSQKGFTAEINDFVENSFIGALWSSVTGSKTSRDIELEKWREIDIAMQNVPLDQAINQFRFLKERSEDLGVPFSTLINELLPGFHDKLGQLVGQLDILGPQFDNLWTSLGGGNDLLLEMTKQWLALKDFQIGPGPEANLQNPHGGPQVINPYFNGGIAQAGQLALAGEIGPEFAVGRNGNIGMLGLNGPELFRPGSDLGIIPNSALHGGSTGNAPDWAMKALSGAAAGAKDAGSRIGPPQSKKNPDDTPSVINANITVNNPESGIDIEKAIINGLKKFNQDKKERK